MKRFKSLVAAALMAVAAIATIAPAPPVAAQSSSSLSIVPRKNYVIEPGKSVKDTMVIRNLDSAQPLDLSLRVIDFTYTDDSGTPKLLLGEDIAQTTWSLKPFLKIPESVTIPAGGTKTIDMSVAIPAGHGAGSYYSAIVYGSGAGDGGNVSLSASGVTLVFTQIPGTVNENLHLEKLGAYDTEQAKPDYVFIDINKPQSIGYTLKNNGNVTEAPVGSIKLKYMFGGEQSIDNINSNGSLALIGQTRTFTTCIKLKSQDVNFDGARSAANTCIEPDLWPGMYTISLDAYYGQNGNTTQEIVGTGTFWYLPIWFLIAVAVLLLIITFIVWRTVVKIRRRLNGGQPKKKK